MDEIKPEGEKSEIMDEIQQEEEKSEIMDEIPQEEEKSEIMDEIPQEEEKSEIMDEIPQEEEKSEIMDEIPQEEEKSEHIAPPVNMQTLNLRLTRDNLSRPWGFRLQGGSDTGYPLSVQRVFSGSPAEGILQRNDEIKIIDNSDVEHGTLKQVQDLIRTSGSQLNFIVVRDPNKEITNIDQSEEKISVQNARKMFASNENRSPQPFGQFGTEYHKKSNTLPTSLKIETNHEFYEQRNDTARHHEMNDEEDAADYSFMTLPVSERKKLFAKPDENLTTRSMPRQRSYSFRPSQKSNQIFPKTQSSIYQRKPQEFGWAPSKEKFEKARNALPNQSTVPLKYQANLAATPTMGRSHPERIANNYYANSQTTPRPSQPPRRFSSSTMIPGQSRTPFTSSTLNFTPTSNERRQNIYPGERVKSQTKYIYHCGRNTNESSTEPSIIVIPASRQPQNLYVNTYGNQSLSPSQSPRFFRPAYPAYTTDHSAVDNMSIISVRSEPYSKRIDRSMAYDKPGTYRILRDSSSVQRDLSHDLGTLQIGEPRTRVIADPASPSCYLNRSFWGNEINNNRTHEQPIHSYVIESSPIRVDSKPFRRTPTVPKSQSTIVMNPSRPGNDSTCSQVSWLKQHRDSMAGISDF